jgi:hypothetical protein
MGHNVDQHPLLAPKMEFKFKYPSLLQLSLYCFLIMGVFKVGVWQQKLRHNLVMCPKVKWTFLKCSTKSEHVC